MSRNSSTPTVPSASGALRNFKMEVANELGISNYDQIDKGQLSSRQNGYVGGNMTKKMVAFAEQALAQGQTGAINSASSTISGQGGQSRQG
ncbi:MAG: alpha/beta-type small acid-soluble spore protein [Bacillota bacterium]|nr:alpha/beta-type small acid-soluble spore protein [Bacillota bacterium]